MSAENLEFSTSYNSPLDLHEEDGKGGVVVAREEESKEGIKPKEWVERVKSSAHRLEKKVSLQTPMHPEMREQVAALATSFGLGSGEFVEQILADQLSFYSERVPEGHELLAQEDFKRPYRAKLQALRNEIEKRGRH